MWCPFHKNASNRLSMVDFFKLLVFLPVTVSLELKVLTLIKQNNLTPTTDAAYLSSNF